MEPFRILLVEDNEIGRETLSYGLTRLFGMRVTPASDGVEALRQLDQGLSPDVVLFDLRMPQMDGRTLRDRVRLRPDSNQIAMVLCSGDATDASEIDVDAVLQKPIDFDEVARTIERVVLQRRQRATD